MDGNEVNPTPTTPETKSSVATLSNLGITPNDFSGFKSYIYSYDVTVPNETESVEIYATKGQSGQTITGTTGTKTLSEGLNTYNIVVTAEDGTTQKTYTLNITREAEQSEETEETEGETEETENTVFGLSELTIEGVELQPQFQTDIYDYTVELEEDLAELKISTLATHVNSEVEITGNENLQEGENIITIIVVGENEAETVAYQIIVNKTSEELVELEDTTEQEQQEKMKKIIILSIAGGLILIIIVIAIIIKVKENKEKNVGYIPYEGIEDDYENNYEEDEIESIEEDNQLYEQEVENIEEELYEEPSKKKRNQKGKRFK